MASRRPLIYVDNNFKEMSDAQITEIQNQAIYLYGQNPSVTLSVVGSGGSLGTMADTRLIGAGSGPDSANAPAPTTYTVNYSTIDESVASTSAVDNSTNRAYPVYYSNGSVVSMTEDDFYDTFILPAIDTLTLATTTASQQGTYYISTVGSGATLVSSTPVFNDTRADPDGITPNTNDAPFTVQQFYLHKIAAASSIVGTLETMFFINGQSDLQQYTSAQTNSVLQTAIRHAATSESGTRIRYSLSSGNNRGSAITDTRFSSSTVERFSGYDYDYDYDFVRVPGGPLTTINTYNLKITQT